MHEATPYGHLLINGRLPTNAQLAKQTGIPARSITASMHELEAAKVFSRTVDGVAFSRHMIRAEKRASEGRKYVKLKKSRRADLIGTLEGHLEGTLEGDLEGDLRPRVQKERKKEGNSKSILQDGFRVTEGRKKTERGLQKNVDAPREPQPSSAWRQAALKHFGPVRYRAWFEHVSEHRSGNHLTLRFPTKFQTDRVRDHYGCEIEKLITSVDETIATVTFALADVESLPIGP
jgi:hypothetical protein